MRIRTIVFAAALGLGPATFVATQASAQPLWDVVKVNLPYTVTIGHKTLSPGEYTIQQLHSDGSPVLLIYSDDGMKFETSAMTIKALDLKTPEDTTVILHRLDNDYYFDKIWIQGKNYGYEFPLPRSVRAREKEMASVDVKGSASTTNTATEPTTTADMRTDSDDTAAAAPPVNTDNTPVIPPTPVTDQNTTPQPVQEPTVTADAAQTTPAPVSSTESSANREKRADNDDTNSSPSMPATSAGWLAMLLGGGTLSSAGLLLRRKR